MISRFILIAVMFMVGSSFAGDTDRQEALRQSYLAESQKDVEGAIRSIASVYNTNPKDFFINMRMAWLNYLKGNFPVAVQHYDKAIAAQPQAVNAIAGKINVFMAQKSWKDAGKLAKDLLKLVPNDYTISMKLVTAYDGAKKYDDGVKFIDSILAHYPESTELLNYKAYFLKESGKKAQSKEVYQRVVAMSPDDAIAKNSLAEMTKAND